MKGEGVGEEGTYQTAALPENGDVVRSAREGQRPGVKRSDRADRVEDADEVDADLRGR